MKQQQQGLREIQVGGKVSLAAKIRIDVHEHVKQSSSVVRFSLPYKLFGCLEKLGEKFQF